MIPAPANGADQDRLDLLADKLAGLLAPRLEAAAERGAERAQLADREGAGPPIPAMLSAEQRERIAAHFRADLTAEELRQIRRDRTVRRWLDGRGGRAFREKAEEVFAELGRPAELDAVIAADTAEPMSKP